MKKRLSLFALLAMLTFTFAMPMTVFAAQVEVPETTESTTDTSGTSEGASDATTSESSGDDAVAEEGIRLGTGDAVNDILMDNRFAGAIESISFITKFVDHWFTVIITATAFFIISAAMLRNVMAGAYCSNHKFWDKVAEAHEKADAISLASIGQFVSGKQFMNTTGGGLRDALLGLVPNIKAWTDFDDVDIEPKQYFMKAIPQMLACVIIGVFIYNGYYRNTAATVGDFGSEICNRVFSSIDPGKVVDKITLTTRTPDNIYKNDPTVEGQYRYTISMAAYKVIVSTFSDYTSTEQKTALMRNCEKLAYKCTTDTNFNTKFITSVVNTNKEYTLSNCKVRLTPSSDCPIALVQDGIAWMDPTFPEDSSETSFVAGYAKIEEFGISPVGKDSSSNDTFYITMSMKKVSSKSNSNSVASKLTSNGSSNTGSVSNENLTVTVPKESGKISGTVQMSDTDASAIAIQVYNQLSAKYTLSSSVDVAYIKGEIVKNNKGLSFSADSDTAERKLEIKAIPIIKADPEDATQQIRGSLRVTITVNREIR